MKGLKKQLKKSSPFGSDILYDKDEDPKIQNIADQILVQDELNNSSGNEQSSMTKSRNRSSTLEIIEEVETKQEQYYKKSIQNLTEREEDNDTEEEVLSEDPYYKRSQSLPVKIQQQKGRQEVSEGESQDSCNESPTSTPQSARGYPYHSKKSPVFKKRMSVIDECLDQIRKRRDLIAAKLISNTYELDEELLDSSDLSEIDQKNEQQSAFELSQQFNSGNNNNKAINLNKVVEEKNQEQDNEFLNISKQENQDTSFQSNQQNTSKLSENLPLISVEKLDSIINPIQLKPSPNTSPKKNQSSLKQSQISPIKNMKQSMSRNFGGSKKFDLKKSTLYHNVGGLSASRMMNATTNNLKKSSAFCFEGFQDRQFARQLQKAQEDEEKSLVRQFENFIEQIKKEKEIYIKRIQDKRDNIKDFFKDKTMFTNRYPQNLNTTLSTKTLVKNQNNSQSRLFLKIKKKDGEQNELTQSINLMESQAGIPKKENEDIYYINFQDYENLNVYELLERIEEEFLSRKQMDPQMSKFLRESMMMSMGGGRSIAFGENMEKTFFPLVVTDQDYSNFEIKKQLDEMQERIKHKNLIRLEQMLDKQKKDLKELEVEYCKVQINYKIFQQNENLKEEIKRERIKNKKKNKKITKLQQSQILDVSQILYDDSDSDEEDENEQDDQNNSGIDQSMLKSQSILNCTLAMSNANFQDRQKCVIDIFNQLCQEHGLLKENMQNNAIIFKQQMKELEEKFAFIHNMNNNMEQALEFNQRILQLQKMNKKIQPPQQNLQDNDNELSKLIREVQYLEEEIKNKKNESDIEFSYKKNKKINQLLKLKNRLNKLQFQRESQSLMLAIHYNTDILLEDKENLQYNLQILKDKFEILKEFNLVYKDQIIEQQYQEIENLKVEIENNQLVQRDLRQKLDTSTQILCDLGSQNNQSLTSQKNCPKPQMQSPNKKQIELNTVAESLEQEKQNLLMKLNRTKQQNIQVENEINNLQFDKKTQYLTNQNMYLEELKSNYYIQI